MTIVGAISVMFQTIIPGPLIQSKITGNVEIQNIHVKPATIKVGDIFTVSATLVNNLQDGIYVNLSPCNGPFVIIDNHVIVDLKVNTCEDILIEKKVNHGEKIIRVGLDPATATFRATTAGTANATVTFYYSEKDLLSGSVKLNSQKTISKSFLFTISNQSIPINASAVTTRIDSGNRTMVDQKGPDSDLAISIEVSNPVKLVGTVTDPNGTVHPMVLISQGQGKMKLSYNATISDPIGSYITKIQFVRGSNTSDPMINRIVTGHINPQDVRPASHPSPQSCMGCMPSYQIQTNGILVPLVVVAVVIGICFFLFRHFKD